MYKPFGWNLSEGPYLPDEELSEGLQRELKAGRLQRIGPRAFAVVPYHVEAYSTDNSVSKQVET